ncbi:MAG: phage tail protein [Rhizobiaceae bacterium]|nr:phage tail protein [Rhizobiaceae bacterium]
MVKTPRTRHSKTHRDPVTIELGADDVQRVGDATPENTDDAQSVLSAELSEAPQQTHTETTVAEDLGPSEEAIERHESRVEDRPSHDYGRSEAKSAPAVKNGGMSNIAAGLIGAVVALGGLYGLQAAGVIGVPGNTASVSLGPVETQIAALKSEVDSIKTAPAPDSGISAAIDQLKTDIAALQSNVQPGGSGDSAALAALDERIKKLESAANGKDIGSQLGELDAKVSGVAEAVSKSDTRLGALEQSVSSLTGRVDRQASQPKVALAIAAAALKSATDRGGPFTAEAETFAAIVPDAPELPALRQYAAKGVASGADINSEFPAVADAMMAASRPTDPNAGILDRLINSAHSLVKVRPVGLVEGDDPGARIARMEVALKAGDFPKAMAEYDVLPESVKQAGATLAEQIRARIEVMKLVDQLVANAMKSA